MVKEDHFANYLHMLNYSIIYCLIEIFYLNATFTRCDGNKDCWT